jgi:hypothetical protein
MCIFSRDEYRHLAYCEVFSSAADAALKIAMATIRSTTATDAERANAWNEYDAAFRTHKAVTQAVEARLTYIRSFKCKTALSDGEHIMERFVYSRFFDTTASHRATNIIIGLLASIEEKRLEVSLHATTKAQATRRLSNNPGMVKANLCRSCLILLHFFLGS